jgi:hypothetical protein
MKLSGFLKILAVSAAVIGLCVPQSLAAVGSSDPAAGLCDVELRDGGVLLGQLVDQQGLPKADEAVVLLGGAEKLAETRTDGRGLFAFRGLRGGVYQLTAADGVGAYRVWATGTAPPSAQPGALLVTGEDLIRSQRGALLRNAGSWLQFNLTNPLFLVGVTAVAIAVPVAIHNADKGGPKSPP